MEPGIFANANFGSGASPDPLVDSCDDLWGVNTLDPLPGRGCNLDGFDRGETRAPTLEVDGLSEMICGCR